MNTLPAAVLALTCVLGSARWLVAQQDPVVRFDAEHARAMASTGAQAAVVAGEALTWFLRIEDGPARDERLERGAEMALAAGKATMGLQLAGAACAVHGRTMDRVVLEVRCLAALGRLESLVRACRDAGGPGQPAAVFVAMDPSQLAQVESQLLPVADRALREGRTEDALWVFDALVQADPENGVRLANLALTLRHLGRRAEAAAAYRQAVEVAPTDDQIRNDRGLFLRACGDWPAAAAELRRALALEARPGTGPAVTNLVQMEALRPGSSGIDAAAAAGRALALRPDAAMLRRVTLDLLGDRLRDPDKRPASR